mmetsp:Transcript_15304/g.30086  ORF Transcript_15304/g.30086 Transcript_15304/m.30086 type:complete len:184 (+) Transcript_15304:117-668(+)
MAVVDVDEHNADAGEEITDSLNQAYGTVALVCALVVAFAYDIGGESVDLGGECEDVNIWQECDSCEIVINVYKLTNYICAFFSTMGCLSAVAMIINLAAVDKQKVAQYVHSMRRLCTVPATMMTGSLFSFAIAVLLQASLTMKTAYFVVGLILFTLIVSVYAVFGMVAKSRSMAFRTKLTMNL